MINFKAYLYVPANLIKAMLLLVLSATIIFAIIIVLPILWLKPVQEFIEFIGDVIEDVIG